MPWKVNTQVENRTTFALRKLDGSSTMKDLCKEYGISRKTGYKWLNRFKRQGEEGLRNKSRRPKTQPHQTSESIVSAVIEEKRKHPKWGPKKLHCILSKRGLESLPSKATLGRILDRYGLVKKHKKRRGRLVRAPMQLTRPMYANHVWGVDFKGWFATQDGKRCEPLTISDLYSRYVIVCHGLRSTKTLHVREVFEAVFRKYGKPLIIRSDNGVPFSSQSLSGLSSLSVWWMSLGIEPELMDPGHPEQNPEHERMHKTLKFEILDKAGRDLEAQQKIFNKWRNEFNTVRPHEAIGMKCPCELYEKSAHRYSKIIKPYQYEENMLVRSVKNTGWIKWQGKRLYLSKTLKKHQVGIKSITPTEYEVYFRTKKLGFIKAGDNKVLPMS